MVQIVNRLFFYPKDVALAVCMGFNPVRECGSWLHKIWRGLHQMLQLHQLFEPSLYKRSDSEKTPSDFDVIVSGHCEYLLIRS
jgi:hypothetical protein